MLWDWLELNRTACESERLGDLVSEAQLRLMKTIGCLDFNERNSIRFNDGEVGPAGTIVVGLLHEYGGDLRKEVSFHCAGKGDQKVLMDAWVRFPNKGVGTDLSDVLVQAFARNILDTSQ